MNRLLCILSLCLLAFSPTLADNLTAEERESVEAEIQKRIEITAEKLEAPALKKVFDATFIKAEVKIESPDGSRSNFDMLLVKSGNRFVSPESATTNK